MSDCKNLGIQPSISNERGLTLLEVIVAAVLVQALIFGAMQAQMLYFSEVRRISNSHQMSMGIGEVDMFLDRGLNHLNFSRMSQDQSFALNSNGRFVAWNPSAALVEKTSLTINVRNWMDNSSEGPHRNFLRTQFPNLGTPYDISLSSHLLEEYALEMSGNEFTRRSIRFIASRCFPADSPYISETDASTIQTAHASDSTLMVLRVFDRVPFPRYVDGRATVNCCPRNQPTCVNGANEGFLFKTYVFQLHPTTGRPMWIDEFPRGPLIKSPMVGVGFAMGLDTTAARAQVMRFEVENTCLTSGRDFGTKECTAVMAGNDKSFLQDARGRRDFMRVHVRERTHRMSSDISQTGVISM